jgi:hypothetical protein
MTFVFCPKHGSLQDDDDSWKPVESNDDIRLPQFHLLHISDHLAPNLDLDKVKVKKTAPPPTVERVTPKLS